MHHGSFPLSFLSSSRRPYPRGAAGAREYPPAQARTAGGHSGKILKDKRVAAYLHAQRQTEVLNRLRVSERVSWLVSQ